MSKNRAIVLTGATGFLGGYLCAELIERTSAHIHCLVRGEDRAHAAARLHERLAEVGVAPTEFDRVTAVPADLASPRLGLTPAGFDELAGLAHAVYHCGANVHLAAGYEKIAPVNVHGVREVLELVRAGRPKALHHVSTMGIFLHDTRVRMVDETTPLPPTVPNIGYIRTKLGAEQILQEAVREGLAVTIHRPGVIFPHSQTGSLVPHDSVLRSLTASVALGTHPDSPYQFPDAPVDAVARAIVALSLRDDGVGRVFQEIRPDGTRASVMFDYARRAGYDLDPVCLAEWHRHLTEHPESRPARIVLALWPILSKLLATEPGDLGPIGISDTTTAMLAQEGVIWPPADYAYFEMVFAAMREAGELPPVERRRRQVVGSLQGPVHATLSAARSAH